MTAFGVKALYKRAGEPVPPPFSLARPPACAGRPPAVAGGRGGRARGGAYKDIPQIPGVAAREPAARRRTNRPAEGGGRRGRRPRRVARTAVRRAPPEVIPKGGGWAARPRRDVGSMKELLSSQSWRFAGEGNITFSYVSSQGERRARAVATNDNAALSLVARSRAIGFLIGAGCLARSARGRRRVEAASGAGTEPLSRFPREMTGAARAVAAYKGPWPGEAGRPAPAAAGSRPGRRRGVRGAPSRPRHAGPCPVRGPPEVHKKTHQTVGCSNDELEKVTKGRKIWAWTP